MDRAEAIGILDEWFAMGRSDEERCTFTFDANMDDVETALKLAIAALREQEQKRYTVHEVAVILAEFTGDDCACNFNDNNEWLPEKCELLAACPRPVGVACWEQYLKHLAHKPPEGGADHEN